MCYDCKFYDCAFRRYGGGCDVGLLEDPKTPIESNPFDWASFRNEAAKDILCSLLQGPYTRTAVVDESVRMADELIEKLKEEKK
jgi:hypothetical protein